MPGSDLHARRLLVALLLAAVVLAGLLIRPFWVALFFAAVLAGAFRGWMEWLTRHLRRRRNLAAAIISVVVLLAVVLPIAGLGAVLVREAIAGVSWLRGALESEGVWGLVQRLPAPAERLIRQLIASLGDPQQKLQEWAGAQGGQAAAAVGGVLAATGSFFFQAAMMLIAFFFFLVDGQRLVDWLDERVPLAPGQFRELLADFRQTSVSVLVATVATAGIQTVTALAGYLVARAPNPIFLALLTLIAALIPAAGATVMVIAVAALQIATGHLVSGIFLAAWGLVVVSLIDNIARPYLLKGGMAIHGGVVFFALLGGIAVFGPVGLVVGPLVVTFLITALNLYRREVAEPSEAPLASAGPGTTHRPPAGRG